LMKKRRAEYLFGGILEEKLNRHDKQVALRKNNNTLL
jgi:hypothetical protein